MTATLLRRRRPRRPVIVSLSNHYRVTPAGFGRDCLVRLPDGQLVQRAIPDELLVRLGLVVAA